MLLLLGNLRLSRAELGRSRALRCMNCGFTQFRREPFGDAADGPWLARRKGRSFVHLNVPGLPPPSLVQRSKPPTGLVG